MTVPGKIRNAIAHTTGSVVLRSGISKSGSQPQVSTALSTLINDGELGNHVLVYPEDAPEHQASPITVPTDLDQLPKKKVQQFVSLVAQSHKIVSSQSRLDAWAEAVTRAAGDSVKLDQFGQTLLALYKAQLINGKQMSRLMSNYMLEKKSSDSLRPKRHKLVPSTRGSEHLV
jgi:hypothetical protein